MSWKKQACYYVSAVDAGRFALVMGPFSTHKAALLWVDTARAEAETLDRRAVFYGFGTVKMVNGSHIGKLNYLRQLEIPDTRAGISPEQRDSDAEADIESRANCLSRKART